jgi:hydrophobic/amphiphilic exporter-1 (mainly G- bacteria), HAE1 family
LTPMLVSGGEGAELRSPLALTMMFGLSFSTLLVLYILPALYLLFMPTHPTLNETGDVR